MVLPLQLLIGLKSKVLLCRMANMAANAIIMTAAEIQIFFFIGLFICCKNRKNQPFPFQTADFYHQKHPFLPFSTYGKTMDFLKPYDLLHQTANFQEINAGGEIGVDGYIAG